MAKIKITKETKEQRSKKVKERPKQQELQKIKAKYQAKVDRTFRVYNDKTWGELWVALDLLKEQMRKELKEIGIE